MVTELKQLCSVPGCFAVAELAVRFEPLGEEYFLCEDHGALKKEVLVPLIEQQRCVVPGCDNQPEVFVQLEPHGKIFPLCEAHGELKHDAAAFKKFVAELERSKD